MEDTTVSIPKLPNDVIIEIFTRLPVKSLLKFRRVCKSWRALISSHQFIRAHLEISKSDSIFTAHRIILHCRDNLKQISLSSILREPISEASELNCSVQMEMNLFWMVGSCDGLICLSTDRKDLVLWNPLTRIFKKLPAFGVENVGGYFAYGVGFDKSSNDYKVVGFFNSKRNSSEVIVQVYSLRNDQWKRIKNCNGRSLMKDPGVFVNGKLYWVADQDYDAESGWDIVSLDLEEEEECEILHMPSYVKSGYYSMLTASEGSLYAMCSHMDSADVWIMNGGCSVGENWTKVITIPYIDDFLKYTYKKILHVTKNGLVLLLCGSTFVIFNAEDCSFRYPDIRNSGKFFSVCAYLESLVSPVG